MHSIIEKLLDKDFEEDMKKCKRPTLVPGIPPATFKDDFGSLLQFLSTMMLHQHYTEMHPRFGELVPRFKEWNRKYRGGFIGKVTGRLVEQLNMDPMMITMMKEMQRESLSCGVVGCRKSGDLLACNGCKIQRYCVKEHQKADWKYHKHICNKGLVEPGAEETAS